MKTTAETYRIQETHGKSQLELILKVYDGALAAYRAARECYCREDYTAGYAEMEKGKKFVVHLHTTLDAERGGEVAENLGRLYSFVVAETSVVEATKDLSEIDDIITVLMNLREGWSSLEQQDAKKHKGALGNAPSIDSLSISG